MAQPIRIGNSASEFLVDVPEASTKSAVIFLPGMSGGALSDRFQPLVDACLRANLAIARLSAWKGPEDIGVRNLSEVYADIGAVSTYLHEHSYDSIYGIGKSMGGAFVLTFPSVYVSKRVLWAPAISVAESGGNIEAYMSAPLGSLRAMLDLEIDRESLKCSETSTLIIHGTADTTVPFSNSERIVSLLPDASLFAIEGANHSYDTEAHEQTLVEATVNFLTDKTSPFM